MRITFPERLLRGVLALTACALAGAFSPFPALAREPAVPCVVLAEMPHSATTSTQGFFIQDNVFFESSGGFGTSFLIKTDPVTGKTLRVQPIDSTVFAEGIAPLGDDLLLLTWKSGTGFRHSGNDLAPLGRFPYRGADAGHEGWGLTVAGDALVMSSGTEILRFLSPSDFSEVRSVRVTSNGKPVRLLNELEYVDGLVYANIWKMDKVAIIDPASGQVRATLDMSPLRSRLSNRSGVANGIAFDAENRRLFVTGKHWDKVFEIAIPAIPGP